MRAASRFFPKFVGLRLLTVVLTSCGCVAAASAADNIEAYKVQAEAKLYHAILTVGPDGSILILNKGEFSAAEYTKLLNRPFTEDSENRLPLPSSPSPLPIVVEHELPQSPRWWWTLTACLAFASALWLTLMLTQRRWRTALRPRDAASESPPPRRSKAQWDDSESMSMGASGLLDDNDFIEILALRVSDSEAGEDPIRLRYRRKQITVRAGDGLTHPVRANIRSLLKQVSTLQLRVNGLRETRSVGGRVLDEPSLKLEIADLKAQQDEIREELRRLLEKVCDDCWVDAAI